MKNRIKTTLQLILFLAVTAAAIYYVMIRSPFDSLEQHSSDRINRPTPGYTNDSADKTSGDDVSLTGAKGRYDEALIGRKE
ncbi:MAG TPA: hypothetical protein VIQ81_10660 [Gammaproteobacteria bacterium]